MKEKCDNICSTCPVNGQIYCALMFLRANNDNMRIMSERLQNLELFLVENTKNDKNPFGISGLPIIEPSVSGKDLKSEEEVEE